VINVKVENGLNVPMLLLGIVFSIFALIIIVALIIKPLYEARRNLASQFSWLILYFLVKIQAKIEQFKEKKRKIIEAKMRAEKLKR